MPAKLTQRSDGRWCGSVQVNGKRRYVYGSTEAEAKTKLRELEKRVLVSGKLPANDKRTLDNLLDTWLETAELRPKTLAGYRQTLAHIRPALGRLRLAKLEPIHLQRLYADLASHGKRTPYRAHLLLHHVFGLAVVWGWLDSNPADRVIKPKYHAERKDVWDVEQLHAFLDGTREHRMNPLWTLAALSGARLAELIGLTWGDVGAGMRSIAIHHTLQYVAREWVEGEPKTRSGERTVTLPPEGAEALRRQRVIQAESRLKAGERRVENGYVFTGRWGQPLQQNTVQNAMQTECERLGLPPLTPHGLRHLHASLLLDQGLPVPAVASRLGHASPAVTLAVYSHAIGRDDSRATAAIARALAAQV